MLDLTRLRVIDAVARSGSVTAAARELHYSQPSVSHHLARLEAETGAQLLQRVGRGVRLTPAGHLLATRAAEILGRVDAAHAELTAHVGLSSGRVRLAGFSSAIGSLVPGALAALAGSHPDLEVTLTDTHPPEALEQLRTGQVDVAVSLRYDETAPQPPGGRPGAGWSPCSTPPCTCSLPRAVAASARAATRRGSPAATAAASTCSRCAKPRASSRASATSPTTWWSCRRWSPAVSASPPSPG